MRLADFGKIWNVFQCFILFTFSLVSCEVLLLALLRAVATSIVFALIGFPIKTTTHASERITNCQILYPFLGYTRSLFFRHFCAILVHYVSSSNSQLTTRDKFHPFLRDTHSFLFRHLGAHALRDFRRDERHIPPHALVQEFVPLQVCVPAAVPAVTHEAEGAFLEPLPVFLSAHNTIQNVKNTFWGAVAWV